MTHVCRFSLYRLLYCRQRVCPGRPAATQAARRDMEPAVNRVCTTLPGPSITGRVLPASPTTRSSETARQNAIRPQHPALGSPQVAERRRRLSYAGGVRPLRRRDADTTPFIVAAAELVRLMMDGDSSFLLSFNTVPEGNGVNCCVYLRSGLTSLGLGLVSV